MPRVRFPLKRPHVTGTPTTRVPQSNSPFPLALHGDDTSPPYPGRSVGPWLASSHMAACVSLARKVAASTRACLICELGVTRTCVAAAVACCCQICFPYVCSRMLFYGARHTELRDSLSVNMLSFLSKDKEGRNGRRKLGMLTSIEKLLCRPTLGKGRGEFES